MRDLSRRRWLLQVAGAGAAIGAGWSLPTAPAWAGAQKEEQLSDAVRTALAAQIAEAPPPQPHFRDANHFAQYWVWLATESARLQNRIPGFSVRRDFLQTVWYEAHRAGLEPALILGLIQVESGFKEVCHFIGRGDGLYAGHAVLDPADRQWRHTGLFHMQVNLRYGCVILRHYLNIENGSLFYALGRYNGSRGKAAYPDAVLAARQRWLVAGGSG
jgi:hypothetical protein